MAPHRAGGAGLGGGAAGGPPPARPGFTLIEIVVVLAILGVSVALVLPAVGRGTDGLRLRTEAGRVAALLRQARERAVGQRHAARVSLNQARNTVTLTVA
ncbi:MAG: pilus assembly FimT family protein, partial [Candidatus Methylomirabilales bacterium]